MEIRTTKGRKIISFNIKKEAIEELEREWETEESLCEKHGIILKTLSNWKKQVKRGAAGHKAKLIITDTERRKAVRELESGTITVAEAMIKYGARHKASIQNWIKKFSSDISSISTLIMSENQETTEEQSASQQRCKELERALSLAQLKIAGLETLIDVAEKELCVDIRKKSGTKQS